MNVSLSVVAVPLSQGNNLSDIFDLSYAHGFLSGHVVLLAGVLPDAQIGVAGIEEVINLLIVHLHVAHEDSDLSLLPDGLGVREDVHHRVVKQPSILRLTQHGMCLARGRLTVGKDRAIVTLQEAINYASARILVDFRIAHVLRVDLVKVERGFGTLLHGLWCLRFFLEEFGHRIVESLCCTSPSLLHLQIYA